MSVSPPVSFDRIADRYDETRDFPQEQQAPIGRGILAAVRGRMGTRFVEPGIGTGRLALPLLRQGVSYTGADISPLMLQQVRRKLQQEPWLAGQATLIEADAVALPLEDSSFDVAITSRFLDLLPDWRRAMAEIARVLRPGGCYVHAFDDRGLPRASFIRAWRDFAEARGVAAALRTKVGVQEILDHLGLPTKMVTSFILARWPNPATVEDMLRRFRERDHSRLGAVGDDDHAALMEQLEAWALATYGDKDQLLASEASFSISVIRLD